MLFTRGMRVLHLLASPVWSGPVDIIATLAEAQRALGHQVSVAIDRKREKVPAEEPAAPRLKTVGLLDDGDLELSVKSSPAAVLFDVRMIRRREVDVVHAHFSHDHLIARFGRPPGAKLVRSIHAPRSIRWSLPQADGYTVPAAPLLERLGDRRTMVLPPLVAPWFQPSQAPLALRRELGLEGEPIIGMVSTFQASRRHSLGVEAFAKLLAHRPGARLVLVGDGLLVTEVRRQVAAAGLARYVTFAGYRSGMQFVRYLQAMDEVWVLGSGNDWSGRAAAQARACGARVVAVDEGGLPAWADVVLEAPDADEVVNAALIPARRDVAIPSVEDVAAQVLAFYAACGVEAPR